MGERPKLQSCLHLALFQQTGRSHLVIPCWLKLLRRCRGKYPRLLQKELHILLPAYLGVGRSQSQSRTGSLSKPIPSGNRGRMRRKGADVQWGGLYWERREERISGGLLQGTALTWEVACAPWRACSRAISAASSSVLLNKVRGSLKCSKSSLTRAWKEPQDTDTTFPPGLYHRAGSLSKFGWVMDMRYGGKGRNKILLLLIIGPHVYTALNHLKKHFHVHSLP